MCCTCFVMHMPNLNEGKGQSLFKWHSQNQLSHSGLSNLCVSFFGKHVQNPENCIWGRIALLTRICGMSVWNNTCERRAAPARLITRVIKWRNSILMGFGCEKKKKPFITRSHTESFECEKDRSWCRNRASHSGSPCHGAIWRAGNS